MLIDVVCLRARGVRLRKSELAAPVRGHLEVADDLGTALSFKRPIRVAQLINRIGVQSTAQNSLKPLFDAKVIVVERDTITITGTELESEDGRVREFGQVWRCTLVK